MGGSESRAQGGSHFGQAGDARAGGVGGGQPRTDAASCLPGLFPTVGSEHRGTSQGTQGRPPGDPGPGFPLPHPANPRSQAATSPPASEVGGNAGAWLGRPLEAPVTDHCPQPRDYRGSEQGQPAWSGLPPCSGARPAALPGSAPAAGAPGGPKELRTENRSEVSLDLSFRPPQRAGPLGDRRWPFPERGRLSMARVPGMGTPAQPARGVGLLCGQHPTRGLFRVNHLERDLKLYPAGNHRPRARKKPGQASWIQATRKEGQEPRV